MKISGRQIAAARELLNITQADLSAAAGVHQVIIARIEAAKVSPRESTIDKLREALERRGIVFINGAKPGVYHDATKAIIET